MDVSSSDTAALVKFRDNALFLGDDDDAHTATQIIRTGIQSW